MKKEKDRIFYDGNWNGLLEDLALGELKQKVDWIIITKLLGQDNLEVELDVDLVIPPSDKLGKIILELKKVGLELGGKNYLKI